MNKFEMLYEKIVKDKSALYILQKHFLDYLLEYQDHSYSDDDYSITKMVVRSSGTKDEFEFDYDDKCIMTIPINLFLKYLPEFDKNIKTIDKKVINRLSNIIKDNNKNLPYNVPSKKCYFLFDLYIYETDEDELIQPYASEYTIRKIKLKNKNIQVYIDNIEFDSNDLFDEYKNKEDDILGYNL